MQGIASLERGWCTEGIELLDGKPQDHCRNFYVAISKQGELLFRHRLVSHGLSSVRSCFGKVVAPVVVTDCIFNTTIKQCELDI